MIGTLLAVLVGAAIALAAEAIRTWRHEQRDELLAVRLLSSDLIALSAALSAKPQALSGDIVRSRAQALIQTWKDHRAGLVGQPSHIWDPVDAAMQAAAEITTWPQSKTESPAQLEQATKTFLSGAAALQTVKAAPDVRGARSRREEARVGERADNAIAEMNRIAQDTMASLKTVVQDAAANLSGNSVPSTPADAEAPTAVHEHPTVNQSVTDQTSE